MILSFNSGSINLFITIDRIFKAVCPQGIPRNYLTPNKYVKSTRQRERTSYKNNISRSFIACEYSRLSSLPGAMRGGCIRRLEVSWLFLRKQLCRSCFDLLDTRCLQRTPFQTMQTGGSWNKCQIYKEVYNCDDDSLIHSFFRSLNVCRNFHIFTFI